MTSWKIYLFVETDVRSLHVISFLCISMIYRLKRKPSWLNLTVSWGLLFSEKNHRYDQLSSTAQTLSLFFQENPAPPHRVDRMETKALTNIIKLKQVLKRKPKWAQKHPEPIKEPLWSLALKTWKILVWVLPSSLWSRSDMCIIYWCHITLKCTSLLWSLGLHLCTRITPVQKNLAL